MIGTPQLIAVLVAGGLAAGAYFYGRSDGRELERKEWLERDNTALREANAALDAAHRIARAKEQKHAEDQAQLVVDYEKELNHVESERDSAVAAVRRGDVRLRNATAPACPSERGAGGEATASAAASVPPAAPGELSGSRDEAAVRGEAVIDLLTEADELAKEVNFCWSVVRRDRGEGGT